MNVIIIAICLSFAVFHQVKNASAGCCRDTSKEHKCHCHDGHKKSEELTLRTFFNKAMDRIKDGKLNVPDDPRQDSLYVRFEKFMLGRNLKPNPNAKTESKSKEEKKTKSKEASKESSSSRESSSKSSSRSKERKTSSKSESKDDKEKQTPRTFYGVGGAIALGIMPTPPPPSSASAYSQLAKDSSSESRTKSKESDSSSSKSSDSSSESNETRSSSSSESKSKSASSSSSSSSSHKSSESSSERSSSSRKPKVQSRDRTASKALGGVKAVRVRTRMRIKAMPEDPLDDFLKGYYSTKTEFEASSRISSQSVLSGIISPNTIERNRIRVEKMLIDSNFKTYEAAPETRSSETDEGIYASEFGRFTKNGDPYETFRASEEQFEEYTTSELSYMGRSTDDLSDTFSLF